MDRDHGSSSAHAVEGQSRKGRLMGKLFGSSRDRKLSSEQREDNSGDIDAFLHGTSISTSRSTVPSAFASTAVPASSSTASNNYATSPSDTFQISHPAPPLLAKLDTRSISRYPNALPVANPSSSQQSLPTSQRSRSPPPSYATGRIPYRSRKGLTVRFADGYPEIIGEGGDENQVPTIEISKRRRAHAASQPPSGSSRQKNIPFGDPTPQSFPLRSPQPPPLPAQQPAVSPPRPQFDFKNDDGKNDDDFAPRPLRRTQTGFTSISEPESPVVGQFPAYPVSPEDEPAAPFAVPTAPPIAGQPGSMRSLDAAHILVSAEQRKSFIETHQAEMRQAEGLAFAKAIQAGMQTVSPPSSPELVEKRPTPPTSRSPIVSRQSSVLQRQSPPVVPPPPPRRHPGHRLPPINSNIPPVSVPARVVTPGGVSPEKAVFNTRQRQLVQEEQSPPTATSPTLALHRAHSAFRNNTGDRFTNRDRDDRSAASQAAAASPQDVVPAASYDAFDLFVSRMRHMFELFRLHAETARPLLTSSVEDLARAALWWFIVGRLSLENGIRERQSLAATGSVSDSTNNNELGIQQSYTDIAKGYWLADQALPEVLLAKQSSIPDSQASQAIQAQQAVLSHLRKLCTSLQKNDMLPPEDAVLPQTIDKTIWTPYPQINSDVTALLCGNWASSFAAAAPLASTVSVMESLPLSDTAQDYVFSRILADAYLMEQGGRDGSHPSQRLHFPSILSVVRPVSSPALEVVIASQNGSMQMRVRSKKNDGPMWEDVRWRSDIYALEMRMPRGFQLVFQLSKQDYSLLWSMHDFGAKVRSQLYPRTDETPVFGTILKAFQYFETGRPTGTFPKEAVPDCEVALFEKIQREGAATGLRRFHRGFRLAVVSGTHTRTLYGMSHSYLPDTPLQFSFLRGDHGDPALLLRFENARSKGSMVLSFAVDAERQRLQSLLAGVALHRDEHIVVDVPLESYKVHANVRPQHGSGSSRSGSGNVDIFHKLGFKRLSVINHDDEGEESKAPTVLAEQLRLVASFGDCTMADRINVAPGELKFRLGVRDTTSLTIMRQPQLDLSVAVSDVQVPRELGPELADGLRLVQTSPTCRALRFANISDLHAVEAALTGFSVVFDGVATTFAISRRRMVVSLHKKWEAGATRLQVVVQPESKVTQLLAFFEDFQYGHCMSFMLKGTDVFEAFGKGSKAGLKIDDAKFPLPRLPAGDSGGGKESAAAETAEEAFVCLDMPDLPGEHDDISITFGQEAERERFASCLPAPVRGLKASKMF